jgi:hypothetical protein
MSLSIKESPVKVTTIGGVILDKPQDWDTWIYVIRTEADMTDVWQYIDPDLPSQPIHRLVPTKPSIPTVQDVKPSAVTYEDLNDRELIQLDMLREDYKIRWREYDRTSSALANINQAILHSISARNLVFIMRDCRTPYKKLQQVKKRFAPTDSARKLELRYQRNQVKKPPRTRNKRDYRNVSP